MALLAFAGITLLIYWHLEFVIQFIISIFIAFFIVSTLMAIVQLINMFYPKEERNMSSISEKIKAIAFFLKNKFSFKKEHSYN
jgi:hypothetical protein